MIDLKRRNTEAINRFSKSAGGIGRKTGDDGTSVKWVGLDHYLCALEEHMNYKVRKKKQ